MFAHGDSRKGLLARRDDAKGHPLVAVTATSECCATLLY
jgi:hypothetical protein